MVFNRGPFDDSEPKRLAIKTDARLKLRNSNGNVMQAFNHDAFSIGANERNPSLVRFEPKPATNQFRASLKAELLKAEFESIARRAFVSTQVQASRLVPSAGHSFGQKAMPRAKRYLSTHRKKRRTIHHLLVSGERSRPSTY